MEIFTRPFAKGTNSFFFKIFETNAKVSLVRILFCILLLLSVRTTLAQPGVVTQPSNFNSTCQPNSTTTYSLSQDFVVSKCSDKTESFTFSWEYSSNGSTWSPVTNNTPAGFQTYTVTSNLVGGTSTLSITLGANASIGTFQYRCIATANNNCPGNRGNSVTSNTITFTVNPRPSPTFTLQPGATGCVNTNYTYTTQAGLTGYSWVVPGVENVDYSIVSGSIQNTSNTVTLRWLTPGNKVVTINYNNTSGCSAINPTSSTTSISSPPTPTFVTPTPGACIGSNVTYTTQSGASNYIWTFPGTAGGDYAIVSGGTSSSSTTTLRWLSEGNKIVTVNYPNSNGCYAILPASTGTTINSLPAVTFTALPGATACANTNITYTTQPGQFNYVWSVSGTAGVDYSIISGGISTTNHTVTLQWITTGNKVVTVNYNNANSCIGSTPATSNTVVSLVAVPIITAGGSLGFCDGGSVTLTSDAAATYQWYLDGDIIAGATSQTYVANSSGAYAVRVTNASGCEATSAGSIVTENSLPDITVSAQASSLCFSSSGQTSYLNYTNTDGTPVSYSISWNGLPGFTDVVDAALPTGSIPIAIPGGAAGNTSFAGLLTVRNANGCISPAKSFSVSITSVPNINNFTLSAATGCAGTGANITVGSTTLLDGTYTVTYNLSGANVSPPIRSATLIFNNGTGNFLATAPNTGNTTVTITEIALVGCSSSVTTNNTVSFNIVSNPTVGAIAGPTAVCLGGAITLTNTPSGGVWSSSDPAIATVSATGVVNGLTAGTVGITYTTPANTAGCTSSTSTSITVNPLPEIQLITGQTNLCINTTSSLRNATSGGTWSSSDNAVATIDADGDVTTHALGSATITYTTAIENGCANSTSVIINVQSPPTVSAGPEMNICESANPVAITLSGATIGGSASSATWVILNGGSGTLSNTGANTDPSSVTYTPAANFHGTVTLALTSNASNSCTPASEQRIINITEKPIVVPGDAITVCQAAVPSSILLSGARLEGGATTGAWSVSPGQGTLSDNSQTSDPELITYTPPANFTGTIILTLTSNANGTCTAVSATRTINITAPPTAIAGNNLSTCGNSGAINITAGSSVTNSSGANWETSGTGSFTNNTSLTSATYTPSDADITAGSVIITLRANGGACADATSSKTLTITPAATAVAGTDITVCAGSGATNITTGSSGSNYNTILWTTPNGTGVISNPASLTAATYTPGTGETGIVTLILTATANSPCANEISTKSFIINPNATIALTSAATTSSQALCINTPLTAISYAIGGGGTGATFSGLPAGVSGSFEGGVATITGTPTVPGEFAYTINTAGTCAQATATGSINISPIPVGGTLSPDLREICVGAPGAPITLAGYSGTITRWEFSTNGGASWTTIANTTSSYDYGTSVTVPTLFRAVIESGLCTPAYSSISIISALVRATPTVVASRLSICVGESSVLTSTTGYQTAGISTSSGNFSNANPEGWRLDGDEKNKIPADRNNTVPDHWGETNGPKIFTGISYTGGGGKFAIVDGNLNSTLETPVFTLLGQNSATFSFSQAYNLMPGATAIVEISTDGGNTYTNQNLLAQYPLPSTFGITGTTGQVQPVTISLADYIGMSNLRIRFNYTGSVGSSWAIDDIGVPAVLPITHTWTSSDPNSPPLGSTGTITVSPTIRTTYTLTTFLDGCASGTASVTIDVNPLPTFTPAPTTNGVVIACNSATAQTVSLPYNSTNLPTPATYTINWTGAAAASFAPVVNAAIPASAVIIAIPAGTAAGTYIGMISVRNANGCASVPVQFSIVVNPSPTLGTVSSSALCNAGSATNLTVNLTGLLPNSISTIIYQIGTANAVTVNNVAANASGLGSFVAVVAALNDGQNLVITSISSATAANAVSCPVLPTANNSMVLSISAGYVWTGLGTDNLWRTVANWRCGVPPNGSSVIIPNSTTLGNTNFPKLDVSFNSNNFELLGNATIELAGFTLELGLSSASTIKDEGTFIGSRASNLIINGNITENLKFDQTSIGTTNSLLDFTLNSGQSITLANPLWIIGNMNPKAGILNSAGNLTMVSTAATSSNINKIVSPANVEGDVNVQSYITADGVSTSYRGFRSMSSPINDRLITSGKRTYAQIKDYTIVTGPGGVGNGFDEGGWAQPYAETITLYIEPNTSPQSSFMSIPRIDYENIPGTGFYLFFRGSQGGSIGVNSPKVNTPYAAPEQVTITYRGPINKFAVMPVVLNYTNNSGESTNGYNLIGNPYPSSIDWNLVSRSANVVNSVIIYKVGGVQASYINGISNNGGTAIIQPGQGFYVRTTTNGETVSFTENCKTISYPARLLSAPKETILSSTVPLSFHPEHVKSNKQILRLNLSDGNVLEETTLVFEANGSLAAGFEDVNYLSGGTINLASVSSDNKNLAINGLPEIKDVEEVRLNINASKSGSFKLRFSDLPNVAGVEIFLKDALFPDELKKVKLTGEHYLTIDKSKPETYGNKRLTLIFKPQVYRPLTLESFTVNRENNTVRLNWLTAKTENSKHFEPEHSVDGINFSPLSKIKSNGNNKYVFIDKKPVTGVNYYRIKQTSFNDEISISGIKTVEYAMDGITDGLAVYPNPILTEFELQLASRPDEEIIFRIFDQHGKKLMSKTFSITEKLRYDISRLLPGIYILEVQASESSTILGRPRIIKVN